LYETIEKIIPDRSIRFQLDQQLDKLKKAQGLFRRNMTLDTRIRCSLVKHLVNLHGFIKGRTFWM